jgi:SAM-dependent methyltransferase
MNKLLLNWKAGQLRRPHGFWGRRMADNMQKGNVIFYDWMLPQIDLGQSKNILEIGYGTGFVLNKFASEFSGACFYGIDFSKIMHLKSLVVNKEHIERGKMFLSFGDILDYSPAVKFDAAYCLNVIYFWADLRNYFRKAASLMEKEGKFYIYMASPESLIELKLGLTSTFNKHEAADVVSALKASGFSKADLITGRTHNINHNCIIAQK